MTISFLARPPNLRKRCGSVVTLSSSAEQTKPLSRMDFRIDNPFCASCFDFTLTGVPSDSFFIDGRGKQ